MRNLILVLTLFAGIAAHAQAADTVKVGDATYKFDNRRFESLFDSTLIFGHSISSGLRYNLTMGLGKFGEGPGTVLARDYAKHGGGIVNIAEGAGNMETGLDKMYHWLYPEYMKDQTEAKKLMDAYNKSTIIVGADAFYMAATETFDQCSEYGEQGVLDTILGFVEKAHADGKILILGNVPKEDWSQTMMVTRVVLAQLGITPMNESCRKLINDVLTAACTHERNCYILDLEGIVHTYDTTGVLTLKDGTKLTKGTFLKGDDVRPDGINLSHQGVQVLVESILENLDKHPPVATQPGNQPN